MADVRSPADDVYSPAPLDQRDSAASIAADRSATSPPPTGAASDAASTVADNIPESRPSHDGGDGASSVKSPTGNHGLPPAAAGPNPEVLKQVNGVLSSEVRTPRP